MSMKRRKANMLRSGLSLFLLIAMTLGLSSVNGYTVHAAKKVVLNKQSKNILVGGTFDFDVVNDTQESS